MDILFPKSCTVCSKKGSYLCCRCKKLFKRNLPECYICRRLSSDYKTHRDCKKKQGEKSLDTVFVSWEYNNLSSDLLKKFKYNYVYEISSILSEFFVETLSSSVFPKSLNQTLLLNVPIAKNRLRERGFNQTLDISKAIANTLKLDFSEDLLLRKDTYDHQSMKDRESRTLTSKNDFIVKNNIDLTAFKNIAIFDDVLTTGVTLESICQQLRATYGQDLVVHGICMFRGRPYYLDR